MKGLLLWSLVLLSSGLLALVIGFIWASSGRYPVDRAAYQTTRDYPLKTTATDFTMVSYNIGYLSGLTNNQAVSRPRQLYDDNLATAIAALQATNPDILALQEVDLQARRSYNVDQVAALSQGLRYPQQAIAINWDKRYVPFPPWPPAAHFGPVLSGQAVLSRFPITRHERLVLEAVASNSRVYNALYLDRLAQLTEVTIGDRTVVVINVHLEAFDGPTRRNQTVFVRQLAERQAQQYPVVVLGDFNSAIDRDAEGEPRSIQTMLESSLLASAVPAEHVTQPEQWTFPSDTPQHKLDYIFYSVDTLELLDVQVLTTAAQASDHLPVAIRLQFR